VAMMLSFTFRLEDEAKEIEDAVEAVLDEGFLTNDIGGELTTDEITEKILEKI
ncbi:MAG TPA: 3-isopropylmalate dehydrogenase, partial [Clostridiales bacterium]|nr:3-isopropylmalate dehydrogenase [Clostridiales bacterium]